ncbi:Ppx/GppA phosphatase family protein [Hirschia litorea]|uniref:Ppx/GppA phosphatase family protein n=1 Tax=Hirschia litorea TaxID=1199156 RepID=A0ABW2II93_9PROT
MARNASAPKKPYRGLGAKGRSGAYAALDLGTNNCRLLIADRAGDSFRVLDSYSRIVRLGEGLAGSGRLSDAAMARAIEALKNCKSKIDKYHKCQVRCIATQACRIATNGPEFLQEVKRATGLKLDTISPKEEAKLALLGSLDLVDNSKDFTLVVDIGGGSTELSWVDAKAANRRGVSGSAARPPILGWASFPVGVVTLSETFPEGASGGDPLWYDKLVAYVVEMLRKNDAAGRFGPLFEAGRGQLLGTSGTVTSLAAVHLGLSKYTRAAVDGVWVSQEGMDAARDKLRYATPEKRALEPCIGPDRAELVLAGCAILDAVWQVWPSERLRAADRGLREGVLLSLIHGPKPAQKKKRSRNNKSKTDGAEKAGPKGKRKPKDKVVEGVVADKDHKPSSDKQAKSK